MAAGIGAQAGDFHRDAVAGKALDDVVDAQELGHAALVLKHDLDAAAQQAGVDIVADADADVGRDAQAMRRLQDQVGDAACHIVAMLVRPAQLQIGCVEGKVANEVEDRLFVGEDSGGCCRARSRAGAVHPYGPASRCRHTCVPGRSYHEIHWHGLAECLRRLREQPAVHGRHVQ